jgi:hypothetical protein
VQEVFAMETFELMENEGLESGWAGPGIETLPDDYAEWVQSHRNQKRGLECSIPLVAASPFCGQGYQNG